jgi:hypothetical protein
MRYRAPRLRGDDDGGGEPPDWTNEQRARRARTPATARGLEVAGRGGSLDDVLAADEAQVAEWAAEAEAERQAQELEAERQRLVNAERRLRVSRAVAREQRRRQGGGS